ncbi:MAG: carboxypeptidase regulatory-like domain-containing protein [Thermofilum sp.]
MERGLRRIWTAFLLLLLMFALTKTSGQAILFYGSVVDSEGKPIAGAELAVLKDNLLVTTVSTSPDGSFQLQLPRGDYVLRVYKLGYQPVFVSFSATPERGGSIGSFVLREGVEVTPEALRFTVHQGDRIPIRFSVSNKGLDPIPVTFYLEAPAGWDCRIVTPEGLSTSEVYVLPGSSRNLTLLVSIPYNATSTATVRLIARWAGLQKSYEFKFNVEEKQLVILELPLKEVASYPGALIKIPLRLWNLFPIETTFTLAVSGPAGWIATLLDPSGVSVSRLTLPPGSSRNLTLIVYVHPATASGNYKLVVLVASDFSKTVREVAVSVESRYDLLNLTIPGERLNVTGGSAAQVTLALKNIGNAPTTAFISAKSQAPDILCRFQATGTSEMSTYVLPGEEKIIPLLVEALPGAQAGDYLVTLTAAGSSSRVEKSIVVRVEGSKALEVGTANLFTVAAPGSAGVANVNIANTGTMPLNVTARVVSAPPKFSVTPIPSSATLRPGEKLVLSVSVLVPSNASEGFYNVMFLVEADGLREYRVIVVEVTGEAQLGFFALAAPLAALSFMIVLFSQRRSRR